MNQLRAFRTDIIRERAAESFKPNQFRPFSEKGPESALEGTPVNGRFELSSYEIENPQWIYQAF